MPLLLFATFTSVTKLRACLSSGSRHANTYSDFFTFIYIANHEGIFYEIGFDKLKTRHTNHIRTITKWCSTCLEYTKVHNVNFYHFLGRHFSLIFGIFRSTLWAQRPVSRSLHCHIFSLQQGIFHFKQEWHEIGMLHFENLRLMTDAFCKERSSRVRRTNKALLCRAKVALRAIFHRLRIIKCLRALSSTH